MFQYSTHQRNVGLLGQWVMLLWAA